MTVDRAVEICILYGDMQYDVRFVTVLILYAHTSHIYAYNSDHYYYYYVKIHTIITKVNRRCKKDTIVIL